MDEWERRLIEHLGAITEVVDPDPYALEKIRRRTDRRASRRRFWWVYVPRHRAPVRKHRSDS